MRQAVGWLAVVLSTFIACFWAFWGIVENFHEGWFHESFFFNVGLMFVQYLSPMIIFVSALSDIPQNAWRLPTVEEAVRSMSRHGVNSGGTWNEQTRTATYRVRPDKESPLWNVRSQVIYWWTATEVDGERAYIVVYDGKVWQRRKRFAPATLGYRCVKPA